MTATIQQVVVTGRDARPLAAAIQAARPDLGVRVVEGEPTAADLTDADVLVGPPPESALVGRTLRWVHSTWAGVDRSLLDGNWPSDVLLTRTDEPFGGQIGEYVLARLLAVTQRLPAQLADQRRRAWRPAAPVPLAGTTAVIVGTGEVGSGIARAVASAGVIAVGVSRSGADRRPFARVHRTGELPALLPEADWLVLAAPLTPETRGIVKDDLLAHARGTWLVNVARGGLVDEDALLRALDDGRLGGACLDVFATEPLPPSSPLWTHPRVLVSPHVAGVTTVDGAAAGFLNALAAVERGERPAGVVEVGRGY